MKKYSIQLKTDYRDLLFEFDDFNKLSYKMKEWYLDCGFSVDSDTLKTLDYNLNVKLYIGKKKKNPEKRFFKLYFNIPDSEKNNFIKDTNFEIDILNSALSVLDNYKNLKHKFYTKGKAKHEVTMYYNNENIIIGQLKMYPLEDEGIIKNIDTSACYNKELVWDVLLKKLKIDDISLKQLLLNWQKDTYNIPNDYIPDELDENLVDIFKKDIFKT